MSEKQRIAALEKDVARLEDALIAECRRSRRTYGREPPPYTDSRTRTIWKRVLKREEVA